LQNCQAAGTPRRTHAPLGLAARRPWDAPCWRPA
jgi:hypothetical protein